MKRVKFNEQSELKVNNIKGFMKRKVVISGTSAKVTCPKEYLGSEAILIILENGNRKRGKRVKKNSKRDKKINASSSSRNDAIKKRK